MFNKLKKSLGDITMRAYQLRESRDLAMIQNVDPRSAAIMQTEHCQSERFKNFQKKIPQLVRLENITSAYVQPVQCSNGEWVICLTDADGHRTTIWTEASGTNTELPVRGLTNY